MKKSKSDSSTADPHRETARYGGRFAPSPTGPLHRGSLFTAVISYLDARAADGLWLLRLDDLDEPRTQPGAEAAILRSLEAHGLHWDGAVDRQSDHLERYHAALEGLRSQLFYCRCSRRSLAGSAYPGTCRSRQQPLKDAAIRVRVRSEPVSFDDRFAGPQIINLQAAGGDFIVKRRDGLYAYQLATAVDDGAETINNVVRGRDLLDSTSRQLWIMDLLGLKRPRYGHVPVIVDAAGTKLSKQHGAPALRDSEARSTVQQVLQTLALLSLEETRQPADLEDVLQLGIDRWRSRAAQLAQLLGRSAVPEALPAALSLTKP